MKKNTKKPFSLEKALEKKAKQQNYIAETIHQKLSDGLTISLKTMPLTSSKYVRVYSAGLNGYIKINLTKHADLNSLGQLVSSEPYLAYSSDIHHHTEDVVKGSRAIVIRAARNKRVFSQGFDSLGIDLSHETLELVCRGCMPTFVAKAPMEVFYVFRLKKPVFFNDPSAIKLYNNMQHFLKTSIAEGYRRDFPDLKSVVSISFTDHIPFEGALSLSSGESFVYEETGKGIDLSEVSTIANKHNVVHAFAQKRGMQYYFPANDYEAERAANFYVRLQQEEYDVIYEPVKEASHPHVRSFRLCGLEKIASQQATLEQEGKERAFRTMTHMWIDASLHNSSAYLREGNLSMTEELHKLASLMGLDLTESDIEKRVASYAYDYFDMRPLTNPQIRYLLSWDEIDCPEVYLAYHSGDVNYRAMEGRKERGEGLSDDALALTIRSMRVVDGNSYRQIQTRCSGLREISLGSIKGLIELGEAIFQHLLEIFRGAIARKQNMDHSLQSIVFSVLNMNQDTEGMTHLVGVYHDKMKYVDSLLC